MSIIKKEGFNFAFDPKGCESCQGNCCIGESGNIWINKEEMINLSEYLKISLDEVMFSFLEKRGYKYSIKETKVAENNYACVFFDLERRACSIYEVRPVQCRTFPFWDYFKTKEDEVKKECPAILDI
ncbi:YkgJ family cysteine cluster protein [Halarcobacter ebronensis]|uniref:Zinc/iron-chelating domain-containing protein n=1 Tax=Halarcobacter ebronensis TaxID=1462615 RepID=A0A4V1M0Q6_9BACT|nr:YkgJ family cysteine cluster protein [Halarcobacter ebronensis]QKF82464.1 putative [Fe-S] cluster-containing protein [Halarcobacter ebronensis]RXK07515.1 zinc/iron-chelating domain-containing protein [Halarcobacter ebronensis]